MASKILIGVSVLILIGIFAAVMFFDQSNTSVYEATGLAVSLESFPVYIETHPIMKDLPKDASVSFNIGGQAYGVEGKEVVKDRVVTEPDVYVELPSGYESRIGEVGLCTALSEAVKNGDLKFEVYASNTKLLMKYYKLIKYKKCLE